MNDEQIIKVLVYDSLATSLAVSRFKLNSIINHVTHTRSLTDAEVKMYVQDICKVLHDVTSAIEDFPSPVKEDGATEVVV